GRHPLTKAEVGPGGFPDGLEPAFYFASSSVASYVRPLHGPADNNGPGPNLGSLNSSQDGALLVVVHQAGQLLDVDVTATPTDGSNRTFALGSQPTGAGYTFDWHLPGGATTAEQTPTYTFAANALAGSYTVSVGVEGSDGSFGWGTTTVR